MDTVIEARRLSKDYAHDDNRVSALKDVDLEVARGALLALM